MGYSHPAHFQAELTSSQVGELMAFRRIEPPGYRQAWQFSVLASLIYNSVARKGRALKPEDFIGTMLRTGPPRGKEPAADWGRGLLSRMMAVRGKHKGKKPNGYTGNASGKTSG